jgi:ABC-2 type transport system ATP-binding protein
LELPNPTPKGRSLRRLSLTALAVTCALAAPAAAHAAGYSVRPLRFDVAVGPAGNVHCTIDADLYRPDGASAAHPAPAILATNGFGGDKTGLATIATSYASRGYVFLAYSGLGFGNSSCKISLDDPDWDGKAGSQLVSFLGGSKAAADGTKINYVIHDRVAHDRRHYADDPRVGMLNGSYGGEIQFSIAGRDPRVDAIAPLDTWNDLSYSLAPNNTDFTHGVSSATPGVLKLDWPAAFTADGMTGLKTGDPSRLGPCPNFTDAVCGDLTSAIATGYPSASTAALLRHASVSSYIARIRIPVLLAQGEHDTLFDLQESVATYRALRAQGTPVRYLWESAGHSGGSLGSSEYDPADPEAAYQSRIELEWYNYYLKHTGPRPPLDFGFYRDWVPYRGDAAPAVGSAPSYPVAHDQTLYLSGTGTLTGSAGSVRTGEAQILAEPAPSSTGGGIEDLGAHDAPATSVSYTTAPLSENTDVVGIPELTLHLDAPTFAATQALDPASKLVLFVKLLDINPATNTATLPENLVTAVRVPDVTKPVHIELQGIAHRFAAGHQIRLTVTTSDLAYRGNDTAGTVGLPVNTHTLSPLGLPILGPQTAPSGTGPDGTTPFSD